MNISLVGLSHNCAGGGAGALRARRRRIGGVAWAVGESYAGVGVLSTCNRTEIYIADSRAVEDPRPIMTLLRDQGRAADRGRALFGDQAGMRRRGTCFGLRRGSSRWSLARARSSARCVARLRRRRRRAHTRRRLSRLFHTAIRVGRKVREQTTIGRRPVSVSSLAVELARTSPGDLTEKTVLVIGAGEAGQLTASNLIGAGVGKTIVSSRTAERTADIAAALGCAAGRVAAAGEGDGRGGHRDLVDGGA